MTTPTRARLTTAVAIILIGVTQTVLVLESAHTHANGAFASQTTYLLYMLVIGWGFAGAGLYADARRPANATGRLMIAVGCAWLLRALEVSSNPVLFAVGSLLAPLAFAVLNHLLLAFPSGRLETRGRRWLARVGYVNVTVLQLAALLVTDTRAPYTACEDCPPNPLLISGSATAYGVITTLQSLAALVVLLGLSVVLVQRWRRASRALRRSLSPILITGALTVLLVPAAMAAAALDAEASADASLIVALTLFAAIPFAFLLGLLRSTLGEAEAVTAVVSRLGEASGGPALRDALAQTLNDPSLQVAYWVTEITSYVDTDGRRVALPIAGERTVATHINDGDERVAVIIHDASLEQGGNLVATIAAAASLTLRNERLGAELRVRVAELRASRTRLVAAGDEQRRRIERDLHDGAQQRLMALGMDLRLVRDRVDSNPAEAIELLDDSLQELREATAELRELARGIHPAVLTNRGLGPALKGLADRSPVPVLILETPQHRLPPAIESAVYFVVAEALTNAARYAMAQGVTVNVLHREGRVDVRVADDGIGGADSEEGSGLRGLRDRITALDGRVDMASVRGEGTTIEVTLPCA